MRSNGINAVSRRRGVVHRYEEESAGERPSNIFRGGAAREAQLNDGKATRENEDAGDEARRGSASKNRYTVIAQNDKDNADIYVLELEDLQKPKKKLTMVQNQQSIEPQQEHTEPWVQEGCGMNPTASRRGGV